MVNLPTAKILLFIALNLGPKAAPEIYATSNSESYVWTPLPGGWTLVAKGFPASDFSRDPSKELSIDGDPAIGDLPDGMDRVAHHDWSHDSVVILDNGDRVEKCGDHAFYIVNAGGPNEKDFTILFPKDD